MNCLINKIPYKTDKSHILSGWSHSFHMNMSCHIWTDWYTWYLNGLIPVIYERIDTCHIWTDWYMAYVNGLVHVIYERIDTCHIWTDLYMSYMNGLIRVIYKRIDTCHIWTDWYMLWFYRTVRVVNKNNKWKNMHTSITDPPRYYWRRITYTISHQQTQTI